MKIKIFLALSFLTFNFALLTSPALAQTPCSQVPTSTWRGVTTYDVCGSESCSSGVWTISCHSSVNSNCVGTYSDGACTTGTTSTSTSTESTCSVSVSSKSLQYRNVDGNNVTILSDGKSIVNTTSSSVRYILQANSSCSLRYNLNLYYWNPDTQKWIGGRETGWQSTNSATFGMEGGVKQYSAGFGVRACNTKGCDTQSDWINFWYMQVSPTNPIKITDDGIISGSIIVPHYIPVLGPQIGTSVTYQNPAYYLLVGEDAAIRANQSVDSKEIVIPARYISWSNATGSPDWKITFSANGYPIPNLQNGKTYYWRLRQQGTGTAAYIPGNSFVASRSDTTLPVINVTITPSSPQATDDITILSQITDTSTIIYSAMYVDGELKTGCTTSPPGPGCNSGGISGLRLNAGTHTYKVIADDKYNNTATKEGSFTVRPVFSVSHSPTLPDSSSNVAYSASGIGISNIKIYVDGVEKASCSGQSCLFTEGGPYAADSTHSYYATTTDSAGNALRDPPSGTKSLTVASSPVPANPRITNNDFGEVLPKVSCVGENFCMGVWNKAVAIGSSCCWSLAEIYYSVWSGSSWSSPAVLNAAIDYGGGAVVSCLSASSCLAAWTVTQPVNGFQKVFYASWNGNSWSSATNLTPADTMDLLPSVSCAGSKCILVWRRYTGSLTEDWRVLNFATKENAILYANWTGKVLSTPTAINSNIVLSGGGAWGLSGNRQSLSCVSDNFCMLLRGRSNPGGSYIPQVSIWNGSSWSTTEVTTGNVGSDVSCSSSTYCMSTSGGGTSLWNGTSWTAVGSGGSYAKPSCYSNYCLLLLSGAYYNIYHGTSSFRSGFLTNTGSTSGGFCPSANMCMVLSNPGSKASAEIYYEKINPSAPAPTVTPQPTPSPTPTLTSIPTASPSATPIAGPTGALSGPSGNPCALTSASWSIPGDASQVNEGTSVILNVQASGDCTGQQINFEVKEDDGVFGSDPVRINPSLVSFVGNSTTTSWVAEYQPDGLNGVVDPPEYYFEAKISGETATIRSQAPQVEVVQSGASAGPYAISGSIFVDSNNNGVKDSGEACFAGSVRVSISLTGRSPITYTQDANCSPGYKFDNLPAGTYTINIDPITGHDSSSATPWQQTVTVP